jgi:hypothetical protein
MYVCVYVSVWVVVLNRVQNELIFPERTSLIASGRGGILTL